MSKMEKHSSNLESFFFTFFEIRLKNVKYNTLFNNHSYLS